MKAKNQQPFTSELDAKEKLIVYVYEYLIHSGAKRAAETFKEDIGYAKDIKVNDGPGFLLDWWCVFWDLYCAAPERRHSQPESSSEARAFHDFIRTPMSPSITQNSPPQHPQQPPPPQFMPGGPRYGPPPNQPRGPPPRMQVPPQHAPHPGGPPGGFMPAGSPRYAQHSAGPPQQPPHMNQGPMFGPGPDQMGPSPGLNRMTPVGGPPQQVVGPPNGPPPQMIGMPGQQMGPGGGQGGPPPPQVNSMQATGPPRNGSHGSAGGGWQGNVNYNISSPANQPCYSGPGSNQPSQGGPIMMSDGSMMEVKNSAVNGGEPSTPHPDEYVMPQPFGQESGDNCESDEIMKIKQSMQEAAGTKMFEKEEPEFTLGDYTDPQNKWP